MTQLIKDKINLVFNPADISVAHRLGRKPGQGPDNRNIVVKLCRMETKQDLLKACSAVKPRNFYKSESLIRKRSTVLYGLRQARKKHPNIIGGCGSQDGKVYAWIRPPKPNALQARNIRILVKKTAKNLRICVLRLFIATLMIWSLHGPVTDYFILLAKALKVCWLL